MHAENDDDYNGEDEDTQKANFLYQSRLLQKKDSMEVPAHIIIPLLWIFLTLVFYFIITKSSNGIIGLFEISLTKKAMIIVAAVKAVGAVPHLFYTADKYSKEYRYLNLFCIIFFVYSFTCGMTIMYDKMPSNISEFEMDSIQIHVSKNEKDVVMFVFSYIFIMLSMFDLAHCICFNRKKKMYIHKSK